MRLTAKNVAASTAFEGDFSSEGLVALAGDDNAQIGPARTLDGEIDDSHMRRSSASMAKNRSAPQDRKMAAHHQQFDGGAGAPFLKKPVDSTEQVDKPLDLIGPEASD